MDTITTLHSPAFVNKVQTAKEYMNWFLYWGQVLSGVVTSDPFSRDDNLAGPTENNCIWTGYHMMTLCYQFAATWDTSITQKAQETYRALLRLQEVTGEKHLIARSFRPPESKTRENDELDAFFARGRRNFSHEINKISEQSVLTATSKGQMEGWLHGLWTYYDSGMCSDAEKSEIQEVVKEVIGGYVEHGYEIIDLDNKPTDQWSHKNSDHKLKAWVVDFGTYARKLALLKIAHHITQDSFFGDEYQRVYSNLLVWISWRWVFTRMHPGEALRRLISRKQNYPSYHLEALAIEALARYEPDNAAFQTMLTHLGQWSETKWFIPFTQWTPSEKSVQQLQEMQICKIFQVICSKPERKRGSMHDTSRQGEEFVWRCATNRHLVYPLKWENSMPGSMDFSPLDFLFAYWKLRAQK